MRRPITRYRDEHHLPGGGLLGFGLRHEYPVDLCSVRLARDKEEQELVPVKHPIGTLKGSDAVLRKVCSARTYAPCTPCRNPRS